MKSINKKVTKREVIVGWVYSVDDLLRVYPIDLVEMKQVIMLKPDEIHTHKVRITVEHYAAKGEKK